MGFVKFEAPRVSRALSRTPLLTLTKKGNCSLNKEARMQIFGADKGRFDIYLDREAKRIGIAGDRNGMYACNSVGQCAALRQALEAMGIDVTKGEKSWIISAVELPPVEFQISLAVQK